MKKSANIGGELQEIGRLISSAALMMTVRKEVASVMKEGFVVTDGKHLDASSQYDVAVKCGKDAARVARRIRSEHHGVRIERIADDVLGISFSRRGSYVG